MGWALGQVPRELLADGDLTGGKDERQVGVERGQQAVGSGRPRHGRPGRGPHLALDQRDLHGQRLIPLQSLAGGLGLRPGCRLVDAPQRRVEVHQAVLGP